MHKKKKGKKGFVMFKIDFEKAYDKVDWKCLRITFSDFGLPQKIIDIIMNCTFSTTLSMKWNGEKLNIFKP